jgi:hypothetical protein
MAAAAATVTAFYEDVEHLKTLCNFLRSKHGPPIREATLMQKRVHYLKGMYELGLCVVCYVLCVMRSIVCVMSIHHCTIALYIHTYMHTPTPTPTHMHTLNSITR